MAQEDYVIADQTGISFLSDLNDTLAAIVSNNSGATEPATMYAYQFWADTTAGILKQRNAANNAWINVFTLVGIKASDIRNTAAGTIAATDVQAALNELDTEKVGVSGVNFTGPATSTAGDFNLVANTALSDAAATLTAAQLIGGEFTITPTVARIQTLDTAANIISALGGSVDNSNFEFTVVNLAAFDVTIATAAGVTLVGNMVVNDGSGTFRVRRLSGTTVSVTRLATIKTSIINKEYDSGDQTITSGGLLTLSHGLGSLPKIMNYSLKCTSSEQGYSVGDIIDIYLNSSQGTSNRLNAAIKTSTQIKLRFTAASACFAANVASNGNTAILTNSSWKIIIRAFA